MKDRAPGSFFVTHLQARPPRFLHPSCARPEVCACECPTCKRAWEARGRPRPPPGEARRDIHAN